jgi:hypothetical protein
MIEIEIGVDVLNHKQIALGHGNIFKYIPTWLIKGEVEKAIKKEMTKAFNDNLKNELLKREVIAEVSVK